MHSIGQGGENNTGGGYAYNNQNSIQERSQQVRDSKNARGRQKNCKKSTK